MKIYTITKKVLLLILCIYLSLCLVTFFLLREKPYEKEHIKTKGPTITYILIDGLSNKIFRNELKEGRLPQMEALIKKSTYVENGIGSFPTMTGYAYYPFITGMDATKSGFFGLRWFDRSRDSGNLRNYVGRTNIHMNEDMASDYSTIFEYCEQYYTTSINSFANKGVHHNEKIGWFTATSKYQNHPFFRSIRMIPFIGKKLSKNALENESFIIDRALKQLRRNPKVQWITLPSPDAVNHVTGTDENYYDILYHIDSLIGIFYDEVVRLGQKDDRMIAIISDHGISDVSQNINVCKIFEDKIGLKLERGPSTHIRTDKLGTPLSDFSYKDGYFVINGNLSAYLYMRNPLMPDPVKGWRQKLPYEVLVNYPIGNTTLDLPKFVAEMKGIALVAYRRNEQVLVRSGDGTGVISHTQDDLYSYVTEGKDPLAYDQDSLLRSFCDGSFYSNTHWQHHTYNKKYPNALERLYKLMINNDAGDMVICSAAGYDLANDYEIIVGNYKGGHGALRSKLINVPYILYIPGKERSKIPYARSEDIGATVLDHMKIQTTYDLNGLSLISE